METPSFTHLLFDLDHTLWDFERNSEETLRELFQECRLDQYFESEDSFLAVYHWINEGLWDAYGSGKITRDTVKYERFTLVLKQVAVEDAALSEYLAEEYVLRSPSKTHLIPGALEVLAVLSEHFKIVIVTNGFKEVQVRKIRHSGLEPFVDHVIISEDAGSMKPEFGFFEYVVKQTGVRLEGGLVIGDNLATDILGAKEFGFRTVFFNPEGMADTVGASYEVRELRELLGILR